MSALRSNQAVLINVWNDMADAWSEEEACASDEGAPNTGVFARRLPRDSYTHERPLLAATLDLHADDLRDRGASTEDESALSVYLRLTLRP
jgi:hypothetical protein